MTILKSALLCSLRIAFFGSLKAALCAYKLSLPDKAFASAAPESNGHGSGGVGLAFAPRLARRGSDPERGL